MAVSMVVLVEVVVVVSVVVSVLELLPQPVNTAAPTKSDNGNRTFFIFISLDKRFAQKVVPFKGFECA